MTGAPRILIVDDQQEILDLASMVLRREGYDVWTAASGQRALEQLDDGPVELVLLDINMPGMDGWETLRLIRADDRLEATAVVMFSVKGEISDKVHSLQEGAAGYITKPFEVDELAGRVRRVLEAEAAAGGAR